MKPETFELYKVWHDGGSEYIASFVYETDLKRFILDTIFERDVIYCAWHPSDGIRTFTKKLVEDWKNGH